MKYIYYHVGWEPKIEILNIFTGFHEIQGAAHTFSPKFRLIMNENLKKFVSKCSPKIRAIYLINHTF